MSTTVIQRVLESDQSVWDSNTMSWVKMTQPLINAGNITVSGTVAVSNFPSSQPVTGTFFQTTQPVSLATAPVTPVTGTFFQATQPVSVAAAVTVTATNLDIHDLAFASDKVDVSGSSGVGVTGAFFQATQPVSGSFFQATQPVSLAVAPTTPVTGTFFQATQPVSLAVAPTTPVTGTFFQATQPISGTVTDVAISSTRNDTYTTTGNGVAIVATANPFKAYAVQVVGQGTLASLWDVRLEGSLDGTNFDQILQHTNTTGDAKVVFSGALLAPALYVRSRCAGLTLGTATGILVTLVAIQ